jgi:putative CocE/NonD family hydrolase
VQRDGWRTFGNWPPAGTRRIPLYLADRRRLVARPARADVDTFDYLPRDPTPTVGGPLITGRNKQRRNGPVERRADTVVFTGRPLRRDVDVVGHVRAVVHLHTSHPHADLFVRLCDVDRLGVSRNVCDGIHRLRPGDPVADGDGIVVVEVQLWPTAYRFRRGHRLRVVLAGGAFPRYARNHGSDGPVADAVAATPIRFTIHHDPAHPSRVELPWLPGGDRR